MSDRPGPAPAVDATDPRAHRRPDLLPAVLEAEIVPVLEAAPGLQPIAILEEIVRRHPDLGTGNRGILKGRIRSWRAIHGEEQDVILRRTAPACPTAPT